MVSNVGDATSALDFRAIPPLGADLNFDTFMGKVVATVPQDPSFDNFMAKVFTTLAPIKQEKPTKQKDNHKAQHHHQSKRKEVSPEHKV